jgi:hypothetical protein
MGLEARPNKLLLYIVLRKRTAIHNKESGKMAKHKKSQRKNKKKTPYDELIKHLLDNFGSELVSYLGEIEGIKSCKTVGGEVEITHRLTDRLLRVKVQHEDQIEEFIVHLEFASSYNEHIGRRLGMYGFGVYEREQLPVMHILWYVGQQDLADWPTGAWYRTRSESMQIFGVQQASVIWREVWLPGKYTAQEFIKEAPPYLLPFAALMPGVERPFIKQLFNSIIDTNLSEERKQDLLVMAIFFLARFFGFEVVQEDINMNILESNPFIEYIKKEGEKKGREEGREEELKETIKVLAKRQFPRISKQTLEMLDSLKLDHLRQIIYSMSEFPNTKVFREAIRRYQSQSEQ